MKKQFKTSSSDLDTMALVFLKMHMQNTKITLLGDHDIEYLGRVCYKYARLFLAGKKATEVKP